MFLTEIKTFSTCWLWKTCLSFNLCNRTNVYKTLTMFVLIGLSLGQNLDLELNSCIELMQNGLLVSRQNSHQCCWQEMWQLFVVLFLYHLNNLHHLWKETVFRAPYTRLENTHMLAVTPIFNSFELQLWPFLLAHIFLSFRPLNSNMTNTVKQNKVIHI